MQAVIGRIMRIKSAASPIVTLLLAVIFPLSATASEGDYVVLLHGIARSAAHMKKLEHYLTSEGYSVINLNYPSTRYPLEELIAQTHQEIEARTPDKSRKIHFIGYSMGGLVVRGILAKYRPLRLGRVVLLAPPNHGSEVADFIRNNPLYKRIYGPAGQQLTTNQTKISSLFGKVDYELGIIAGDRAIDPVSYFIIPGKNDGKVSIESTKLEGMKDHITLHATHTFFPTNAQVLKQTAYFLREGIFHK